MNSLSSIRVYFKFLFLQFRLFISYVLSMHREQAHVQNCSKLSMCFPVPPLPLLIYIATCKANNEEFKTARISIRPRISQIKYRSETGIIFVQYTVSTFFITHRPRGPYSLLYSGYYVFSGGKAARAWCWPLFSY